MPGLGRYPCASCHYVAGNRRMLARHAALMHSDKSFKCPLCPFVTRYAANWYRHKRDLHGLNKITTCEICGFFANSTAELAQHKESEHPEQLQLEKYEEKYAKEKIRLSAEEVESLSPEVTIVEEDINSLQPDRRTIFEVNNDINEIICSSEETAKEDSITFSLPVNGLLDSNAEEGDVDGIAEAASENTAMNDTNSSPENLRPLKVRRSYSCDQCGLRTNNPREYLYHLRSIHGEKISVHECKYCIYASKHVQKLQRHCNLVHRQQLAKDPEYQKQLEASKEKKSKPDMISLGTPLANNQLPSNESFRTANTNIPSLSTKPPLRSRSHPGMFKCSACNYQTRNKALLFHHEKTAHLKKRFYRCLQCGYVTNEKARYTKHIKYHSLPKMQCEYCFFKTAYKWNMDRHMKNHEAGAEGEFRCTVCNFTTSTKQSFKSHVTNHHDPASGDADQDMEILNGEDPSEWEDFDSQENEDECIPVEDNNASLEYEFPDARETPEAVWKDGKVYQKSLRCKSCDFKAAWPFEMKKHEETHKSQKKHPCPLCGMRFEHIAWLTKHLRRVHRESNQAKNIAEAFDLLKPARRRPGKEYMADTVLPMFQEVLKQNNVPNNKPQESKNSMLSSLLKKPLQPFMPSSVNRFSASYRSKIFTGSSISRQPRISSYYEKVPEDMPMQDNSSLKSRTVPTCSVCGYKTRWISELQRHMRVHSQEKPFHCHKCKYHCKWKGDLNRHLMKYHGIKVPSMGKKHTIPKLKLKKSSSTVDQPNDWQTVNQEKRIHFSSSTPARNNDQDSPLDLTLTKDTFPHPYPPETEYDAYDFDSTSALDLSGESISMSGTEGGSFPPYKSPLAQLREQSLPGEDQSPNSGLKRKYQCPFCTFGTTTASRFHVHIVQHYNRRPFMCSVCNYNSNWEWDITKHIRLKGCRDKSHNKACVLLTDETGRRNYEKYDKYLVDIELPKPSVMTTRLSELNNVDSESRLNVNRTASFSDTTNKNCTYDFRNIGSNFEDTPVNIVVTPDINIPDTPDVMERGDELLYEKDPDMPEETMLDKMPDVKYFYCKHCNFKHSTKRVVVSHLSIHAGLKPFRCRACGLSSNWRHVIVRHVKDAHNGYMNEVEDRINYVQEGYAIRLTSVNSGARESDRGAGRTSPQFGCKICPYKCDKEFYIKLHMRQHRPREGAIYRCDFCPYFVKFKKTLTRHLRLHEPPTENKAENTAPSYSANFNSGGQSENYQNDVYEFHDPQTNDSVEDSIAISFDKLNELNQIEQTSPQKIKRHVCENCPYKTDNKTQYLYHKQFHRPNPTANFKCSLCSYWATMQHLLTQHMRVHSESDSETERPSQRSPRTAADPVSELEDREMPEKISIIYVKRGELIVKMFKCEFCPMMNKKKANVRVHQKMHGVIVNNGKFACTYCNYQCLNQGGLTNHIKVHQKVPEKMAYADDNATDSESRKKAADPLTGDESNTTVRRKLFSYFCPKCPAIFKSASDLQSHKRFHGSSLPFTCTYCDYSAKHKPHLFRHMIVHSPEYKEKRKASQGSPTSSNSSPAFTDSADPANISITKKVDQMLLLEASEVKATLTKTDETPKNLHKCVFCPASFFKTSTLAYHISLHGSEGEFKCSQCDYCVSRSANLSVHSQVHPKKAPVKRSLRTFPCPKCPAVFYKQDRYDRHFGLHGKNYKFVCQHCDYSVRFAANLIKHKALHATNKDSENINASASSASNTVTMSMAPVSKPLSENTNIQEVDDRKTTFICDRCPYFQTRKDAVQSHQRRHWLKDGFKCPYCDYSSMQNSFLQSHIKMHIQPHQLFPAQAFMKYESFKICYKEGDDEVLLFDDAEMLNGESNETGEKRKAADSDDDDDGDDDNNDEPSQKTIKLSDNEPKTDDILTDLPNKSKVPVVVLSDIFANDRDLKKWAPKLKIPKLKISRSCSTFHSDKKFSKLNISDNFEVSEEHSQTTSKKSMKPSLVVKIKVENCLINKHEKTLYSVSSTEPSESVEEPLKVVDNENTSDSTSDFIFRDSSDPSLHNAASVSPVPDDMEECTLTSNSGLTDSMKVTDDNVEVEDIMDSIVGPETDTEELIISQPSNEISDLKSDESYSNDTVPVVVSDILCEKLGNLTELSFKEDLSVTNGECSSHLANGLDLLPGEIKVEL